MIRVYRRLGRGRSKPITRTYVTGAGRQLSELAHALGPVDSRLQVVGDRRPVPLVTGEDVPGLNLDHAASTPALEVVKHHVDTFLPWYASVHRGTGFTSQVSTEAYERAREVVRDFVGGRADDAVVFVRNTTDALNLLSTALPAGSRVITFDVEHHANLLPWRRHEVVHLPSPTDPAEIVPRLERALSAEPGRPTLVAVTGVSNVTGEVWPAAAITEAAHRHGARVVVDGAQRVPHTTVDLATIGADWLAFSGHKVYAPFGTGVLIGRRDWIGEADPFLRGGGAVAFVGVDEVAWSDLPERQEAGSPNVVGAVALAAACATLAEVGMDAVHEREHLLAEYGRHRLQQLDGVRLLRHFPDSHERVGVLTVDVEGHHHREVAAILSAEHGIAVRDGCFCAHPLMLRLLGVPEDEAHRIRDEILAGDRSSVPGAVRMSLGLTTTAADIDRAVDALTSLIEDGPRWTYVRHGDEVRPEPDPRRARIDQVLDWMSLRPDASG